MGFILLPDNELEGSTMYTIYDTTAVTDTYIWSDSSTNYHTSTSLKLGNYELAARSFACFKWPIPTASATVLDATIFLNSLTSPQDAGRLWFHFLTKPWDQSKSVFLYYDTTTEDSTVKPLLWNGSGALGSDDIDETNISSCISFDRTGLMAIPLSSYACSKFSTYMGTGDWSGMILNNYDSDRSSQILDGQYGEYAYITSGKNIDATNRPHLRLGYLV